MRTQQADSRNAATLQTVCTQDAIKAVISLGLIPLAGRDGSTLEATRTARRNEADLLPWRRVPPHCRRVPDMLMVTTTVGMLHRVHGHTTDLRCTKFSCDLLPEASKTCTDFYTEWTRST